ncbi:BRO family protein [Umezawaea sp. Da 62-37]|uniref:BRO family protein n=1 Tax=Umezawaea sp. Da 62-37 TaxID=3075927 RepID=UPI0028F6EDF6|nr:BRO family protein [Umezawaea sp. Da 62-37]WNV82239.1 BRO family protein [Umezawaea sp. Da 62-37]
MRTDLPVPVSTVLPADTFRFGTLPVRTVLRDGDPWFVANDVCTVLGYRKASDALRHVDPDDVEVITSDRVSPGQPEGALFRTSGGNLRQTMSLVNEPGLYELILRSSRPEARTFKRWVTHEVLPSIRHTGGFGHAVPTTLSGALELAAAQQRELEAQRDRLAVAEPKVVAHDAFMDARGALSMGAVANSLRIGRNTLFALLRGHGVLQDDNRPYQRYAHHFVVTVHGTPAAYPIRVVHTTLVRPTGVELIRRVLQQVDADAPASLGQ